MYCISILLFLAFPRNRALKFLMRRVGETTSKLAQLILPPKRNPPSYVIYAVICVTMSVGVTAMNFLSISEHPD